MAMLSGYMQRYTGINTVGLCHSVQVCSEWLLRQLGMEDRLEGRKELIAGINHMAWLLEIKDKNGNDLYPEIKERAARLLDDPNCLDKVRLDYIRNFGYYCTESSEHNAEYNMFYIKSKYPELISPPVLSTLPPIWYGSPVTMASIMREAYSCVRSCFLTPPSSSSLYSFFQPSIWQMHRLGYSSRGML